MAEAEEAGDAVAGWHSLPAGPGRAMLLGRGEEALAALPEARRMAGLDELGGQNLMHRALSLAHLSRREEAQADLRGYLSEQGHRARGG